MKNENYWKKRQEQKLNKILSEADVTSDYISKIYHKSYLYIKDQMEGIFDKYKTNYGLSEKEAKQLLSTLINSHDYDEMKKKLQSNLTNAQRKELLKKLDSQAYQYRISKFKDMQNQIDNLMKNVYKIELEKSTDTYIDSAFHAYYRNVYNLQQGTGVAYNFNTLDPQLVDDMLHSKWSGENYSSRIWDNTTDLANSIKDEMMMGVLTNKTEKEMSDTIMKKFAVGAYQARRLIQTESAAMVAFADQLAYEDAGIEKEMFIAVHDNRTSKVCQQHDRSIIDISKAQVGVNVPPLHPNCRSHMIPYIEGITDNMKKRQRNPVTGRDEVVDVKENYEQWLKRQQEEHDVDIVDIFKEKIKRDRFEGSLKEMTTKAYYKLTDEKKFVSFMDLNDSIKDKIFMAISQSKSSNAKDEFINQLSKIQILNERAIGTPHFAIEGKKVGIRLNVNDEKIIDTLIHEMAHHIDYNLGKESNSKIMLSNSNLFINTLKSDWESFATDMMKCYNCSTDKEFYSLFSNVMQQSKDSSYDLASDIIGGLTKNKCVGNYYHESEYWNNMTLCAESFAHFYEAILIDSRQEKVLKIIFPNTFNLFVELF